jgi:hypothetical protein
MGVSEKTLGADESWLRETRGNLRRAEAVLKEASTRL